VKKSRKRRKIELNLKKQTQFQKGQNERKVNYNKEIREKYWIGHIVKTKPIQSQTKPICLPLAGNQKYETLNPKYRHLTEAYLKKQSQFGRRRNCRKLGYNKYIRQ